MAKRRMNGEGTIYQRKDGLWVGEVTVGYDENKTRIKKTVSSMDQEVFQKKLNELRHQNSQHLLAVKPNDYTVGDWVFFWLETYKKGNIKDTTYDSYRSNWELYIKPKIGHYKLDKLTPLIVQNFIKEISEKGASGKELSTSSIKKAYAPLSGACRKAVDVGLLYKNPCTGIEIPDKDEEERTAFEEEEQIAFLKFCNHSTTYDNMFIFGFDTGLRLGEMLALTWDDVNFQKRKINVKKNLTVVKNYDEDADKKQKKVISTPKSRKGRDIPMTDTVYKVLTIQQKNNKLDSPLVFYSTNGKALDKRNVYKAFNKRIARAQITSNVTVHSLRHSFATRLLERGADIKSVSELLGHKSIQITLNLYSHVFDSLRKSTVDLLNDKKEDNKTT